MRSITVSFKCPELLDRQLETESGQLHISKSDLIRKAIENFMEQKGVSTKRSLYSLSKDLCGAIDGPVDLSTNPSHYEGYGE